MPRVTNIFENESKNPMDNIRVPDLFPLLKVSIGSIQANRKSKTKQQKVRKHEKINTKTGRLEKSSFEFRTEWKKNLAKKVEKETRLRNGTKEAIL